MEIKVYTLRYTPFVMGGNTWQPVAILVEADGPHDLGSGYNGFIVTAPNGKTFIAEAESGAFIGPDLKTVKEDISTGDSEMMKTQVADAKIQSAQARMLDPDEFWKLLKCIK